MATLKKYVPVGSKGSSRRRFKYSDVTSFKHGQEICLHLRECGADDITMRCGTDRGVFRGIVEFVDTRSPVGYTVRVNRHRSRCFTYLSTEYIASYFDRNVALKEVKALNLCTDRTQ